MSPSPPSVDRPRRLLLRCALLLTALASAATHAASDAWRTALPPVQMLGAGDMTRFGLRIYRATLWASGRPFNAGNPFALQLRYYRDISRARLVATSMDEIERLSPVPIDAATRARWEAMLGAGLVDVRAGDELTGVYLPGHGMRLYDGQRLLAAMDDEALARAFFDIWLNRDSRDQDLRRHLLGAQR